jgi:molybdopterin/thiamine biosynthesis adenylyltransferase
VNPGTKGTGTPFRLSLGDRVALIELDRGLPVPSEVRLLEPWESLDDRRRGLLPEAGLSNREVHLVGAGSLGSAVGLLLAQAGVGRFRVYDRDWLDTANLCRHSGSLPDLGREKSLVVAEQLSFRGSNALGVTVNLITIDDRGLDLLFKPADIVVATTDSPAVQFTVNEAAVRGGKDAVFAGAYELACGGEVLAMRRGAGPCLYCATGFRAEIAPDLPLKERRQAYQSADENRLDAEPGLAIDIMHLAAITAAYVIALLDPHGSRGALLERSQFSLFHGPSAPRGVHRELFRSYLEVIPARVVRNEACPVCGFTSAREHIA